MMRRSHDVGAVPGDERFPNQTTPATSAHSRPRSSRLRLGSRRSPNAGLAQWRAQSPICTVRRLPSASLRCAGARSAPRASGRLDPAIDPGLRAKRRDARMWRIRGAPPSGTRDPLWCHHGPSRCSADDKSSAPYEGISGPASCASSRISSFGEEIGGLGLVPARSMRATAAECLLPVTSQGIRKHLRDHGVGAGVAPDFMTTRDSELVGIRDGAPPTPSVPDWRIASAGRSGGTRRAFPRRAERCLLRVSATAPLLAQPRAAGGGRVVQRPGR